MITPPAGARVYLACGSTDMRKGMATLAMLVQQTLGHDPFCGTVYAFRGRRSGLIKLLWHDGVGMCLFIKRLERGQFIWPMSSAGTVSLTPGQLSTLLEGCEWRATARNLRIPRITSARCWNGSRNIRSSASMNCCRGTSPVSGKGWISEKLPDPDDTQYVALQGRRG